MQMRDDGFRFEERDDERTWNGELKPDCEREILPQQQLWTLSEIEYLTEFKSVIDACGQVSYFMNMEKFFRAEVNKVKNVAAAYQHNLWYYRDQYNEWRVKAERAYMILQTKANDLGIELPAKVALTVVECEPGVRGDTVTNAGSKEAKLETGLTLRIPLFIEAGEKILVDTTTGKYDKRA